MSHRKIQGFVTAVEASRWWARLFIDEQELEAEMRAPLPADVGVGSLFTIHRPRRGDPYFYWIRLPLLTKRQIKRSRIQARKLRRSLFGKDARKVAV